jgi:hypothetical protein
MGRNECLGDPTDEDAVRPQPIRVGISVKEVLGFCGYLRQFAIDTLSLHA